MGWHSQGRGLHKFQETDVGSWEIAKFKVKRLPPSPGFRPSSQPHTGWLNQTTQSTNGPSKQRDELLAQSHRTTMSEFTSRLMTPNV